MRGDWRGSISEFLLSSASPSNKKRSVNYLCCWCKGGKWLWDLWIGGLADIGWIGWCRGWRFACSLNYLLIITGCPVNTPQASKWIGRETQQSFRIVHNRQFSLKFWVILIRKPYVCLQQFISTCFWNLAFLSQHLLNCSTEQEQSWSASQQPSA